MGRAGGYVVKWPSALAAERLTLCVEPGRVISVLESRTFRAEMHPRACEPMCADRRTGDFCEDEFKALHLEF
jgi:hypothetical protein